MWMPATALAGARWRKSTFTSGAGQAQCVELAWLPVGGAVRDSKHPTGPALVIGTAEWSAFLADAKDGRLDA